MGKLQIGLIIFICCIAIVVFVLVCYKFVKERREERELLKRIEEDRQQRERLKRIEEERQRELVEQRFQQRNHIYELSVYVDEEIYACIQRAQMRTKAESPKQVLLDAVSIYMQIVEEYGKGQKLYMAKDSTASTVRIAQLHFAPLDRVEKKGNS